MLIAKLSKTIGDGVFRWATARTPRVVSRELNQKSTYIFPTRYGWLLVLTVFLMGVGATNYQNNLVFVATFTVIALGVVSILMTYNNLVGLKFSAHQSDPVFAGQSARFPISIFSKKAHASISVGPRNALLHTLDIDAQADNRITVSHHCAERGLEFIPVLRCQTLFPFGFLQAWSWLSLDVRCVVYPKPIEPKSAPVSSGAKAGDYSNEFQPGNEDFYGLKAYQPGDLMSRIHWKSYAREKGLQTKQFVDYVNQPDTFSFDDFPNDSIELRLSYLCYLILQAEAEGKVYGLRLPTKVIEADSGFEHMHRCLHALALFQKPGTH